MQISNKLRMELNKYTTNIFETEIEIKDLVTNNLTRVSKITRSPIESIAILTSPIGALPIGKLEFEIGSINNVQHFDENRNYEVNLVNKYTFDDGSVESFKSKKYYTTDIKYDEGSGRTSFTALDKLNGLSKSYVPINVNYPIKFSLWVEAFLSGVGLSTSLNNLFNKDLIIKIQPNFGEVSNKQVLQKVLEHALSFGFIDDDNAFKIKRVSSLCLPSYSDKLDGSIKAFKANPDHYKSLGINRLVLGLQADIDGENVSQEDIEMIAADGVVEMRLNDLPFAFDEETKLEIINVMFSEIKGFKHKAFSSESKLFHLNFGDVVRQEVNDNQEYYNVPILGYSRIYNGSIMTKHEAVSESVTQTENAFKKFSPSRLTNIKVDKIKQEIDLTIKNVDENSEDIRQIKLDNKGITLKVEDIESEIDDNKNKIESVEKTTKENTSKISLNSLGIQQEINDRTLMGERIIQETNLLVDAKSTQWGLEFTRLETGASETEASLQELKAYYRYTAEEALIGKSGDPMQFYFSNDEAGFRENGDRLSYWKGKKFYVQDLHVLSSIIIGQHLVESKGDVTIFRSVV